MPISIRTLLTAPFVALTVIPAGIVGGLFYVNSQRAVQHTVDDLLRQIANRTHDQLQLYLATPHFINNLNASAIAQSLMPLDNLAELERYFVYQFRAAHEKGLKVSEYSLGTDVDAEPQSEFAASINHVYIGTDDGILRGAEIRPADMDNPEADPIIAISRSDDGQFQQFQSTSDGMAGEALEAPEPYTVTERGWFKAGKALWIEGGDRRAGWSQPYCDQSTKQPAITAFRPVGDGDAFIGVLGGDFLFDDIQEFLTELLADLNIANGHILVIDDTNNLMIAASRAASASDRAPTAEPVEETVRCNPRGGDIDLASDDPIVNALLNHITTADRHAFSSLAQEASPSQRGAELQRTVIQQEPYFWTMVPLEDSYGLKLSIAIAIPRQNFMADINASTRTTVLLCAATVLLTGLLSLLITRRITRPVLDLERASQTLTDAIYQQQPPVTPHITHPSELQSLSHTFGIMATQLQDSFVAFGHFVPQTFLQVLGCDNATEVELGMHRQVNLTILFSDIRSFTERTETMTADESFQFINEYLALMEPAIEAHGGFVDKYIGDAIMALFDGDRSPDHAVQAAQGMLERLQDYNLTHVKAGQLPLNIGIGIHTGDITLGTVGGPSRWDTTVIGRNVNRASRLEGLTKVLGASLLISQETLKALRYEYPQRYLGPATVQGVEEAVHVYELFGADSPEIAAGKAKTNSLFQDGLRSYQQHNYAQALDQFEAVLAKCSGDSVAQYYRQLCQYHLEMTRSDRSVPFFSPF